MIEVAFRRGGSGPPLVLLHGVGGDASNWDEIVPRLESRFTVLRPDLRGHGRSPPIRSRWTLQGFARDVLALADSVGFRDFRLAGFSLGGQVAQSIAIDAPQRVLKLALISTVAGRTDAEKTSAAARVELLKKEGSAVIASTNVERWFTDEFRSRHPEKVAARVEQLLGTDAQSYLEAFSVFATEDLASQLGEIRVPTLIITGELDVAATPRMARLMQQRISHSTLRVLPGMRHSLLIEQPGIVADLLLGFF